MTPPVAMILMKIAAGVDLLAHGAHHVLAAIGNPAPLLPCPPVMQIMRPAALIDGPQEDACIAGIAHGKLQIVLATAIAHRGDATAKRVGGVLESSDGDFAGRHFAERRERIGSAGHAEMNVTVDKAWKQGALGRVNHISCKAVELGGRRQALHSRILDQHRMTLKQRALSVKHQAAREECHRVSPFKVLPVEPHAVCRQRWSCGASGAAHCRNHRPSPCAWCSDCPR